MKLHEKIRQVRKSKNWSQAEAADKLNMSLNAYGCIERGKTRPNLRRLEQLAEVFEMELADLVSEGDRNFFSFKGTHNSNCQNWYGSSPPEALLQLQHELEQVRLVNQQQGKEIEYLKQQIEYLKQQNADLRELVNVLKKAA